MTIFKSNVVVDRYEGSRLPKHFRDTMREVLAKIVDGTLVTFEIRKPKRSTKQNAFYWDTAVPLVQSMFRAEGEPLTATEAHDVIFGIIMKETKTISMLDGARVEIRRSSTDLTTAEWEDAMTILRAWCAKNGKTLAFPNEGEL